jgi:tRNA threonylcarbamoyladenosine biosynthesis protein TsaE
MSAEVAVELPDAAATRAWGARLAGVLRRGDVVALVGPLGAGKTTLTQGIAAGLGVEGDVTSPTFIIARAHRGRDGGPALVHADAYRLGGLEELDALDLDAQLEDAVVVVEWGETAGERLAADRLVITLDRPRASGAGELRRATAVGVGERWKGVAIPD